MIRTHSILTVLCTSLAAPSAALAGPAQAAPSAQESAALAAQPQPPPDAPVLTSLPTVNATGSVAPSASAVPSGAQVMTPIVASAGGGLGFLAGATLGFAIASSSFQCNTEYIIFPADNCFSSTRKIVGISLLGGVGGGVLGAVVAGVLWNNSQSQPVALAPAAGPGTAGLTLSGRF